MRKVSFATPNGSAATMSSELPVLEGDALQRLDDYASRFTGVFARTDQCRWFRAYLGGLLDGGERKNVEAIAARISPEDAGDANPAQALQHFVSHSTWDADRLTARYRETLPAGVRDTPALWVVHDAVTPKKGRHSVGTQRQYARALGRKLNCQVAVAVGRVGPWGYIPLATRLYLPGFWLRENHEAVEKTVPEVHRTHRSKPELGRQLVRELIDEGWRPGPIVLEDGYASDHAFRDRLEADSFELVDATEHSAIAEARRGYEKLKQFLGLDHFEGRTWVGWHHHTAIVLAAYGYWLSERTSGSPI